MLVYLYGYTRNLDGYSYEIFIPIGIFTSKEKLIDHINSERKKELNKYFKKDFRISLYSKPRLIAKDDWIPIDGSIVLTLDSDTTYNFDYDDITKSDSELIYTVNEFVSDNIENIWFPSEIQISQINNIIMFWIDKYNEKVENDELKIYNRLKEKYG